VKKEGGGVAVKERGRHAPLRNLVAKRNRWKWNRFPVKQKPRMIAIVALSLGGGRGRIDGSAPAEILH
jgi:hypothetical protein